MNIHIQAHPDDETSMWGYIHAYGDSSSYHKVFAVATPGRTDRLLQELRPRVASVERDSPKPPTDEPMGLFV
jgi:hypothetical protein